MEGYSTLITAVLVGGGSFLTAVAGLVVQVRRGDPETKARLKAAEDEVRDLRSKLLLAEARIFDLMRRLVGADLMSQDELEQGGNREPQS